jgi:hypothetical protein
VPIPFLACMIAASAAFHLPPRVLPSIQAVEGGRPGLVHIDADGSADFGVMQVNSWWIPRVATATHATVPQTVVLLRDDPCFNIQVGAAILHLCLQEAHGNLVHAVGLYHSHNPMLESDYVQRVLQAATIMFVPHRRSG